MSSGGVGGAPTAAEEAAAADSAAADSAKANGALFSDSGELAETLLELTRGWWTPREERGEMGLERLARGAAEAAEERWDAQWARTAGPVFGAE
jgi:hypothetical protein